MMGRGLLGAGPDRHPALQDQRPKPTGLTRPLSQPEGALPSTTCPQSTLPCGRSATKTCADARRVRPWRRRAGVARLGIQELFITSWVPSGLSLDRERERERERQKETEEERSHYRPERPDPSRPRGLSLGPDGGQSGGGPHFSAARAPSPSSNLPEQCPSPKKDSNHLSQEELQTAACEAGVDFGECGAWLGGG